MAIPNNIKKLLNIILEARYGKDVRNAIHDSIEQCVDYTQDSVNYVSDFREEYYPQVIEAVKNSSENAQKTAENERQTEKYADSAASSATSASKSATAASDSATAAAGSADESRKYSESWKGSLLPKGVVSFSQLPASGMVAGHLYGVKEPFLTDSRFEEGVGHHYPQWTCVYWTQNNKWKVLSGVLSLEITEAEYNALSEAEQKNGTIYYVKDADNTIEADEINGLADWAKAKTKPSYSADEVGLGNVGNFKAVSTVASQGLTDTEKSNARANIGAQASGNYAPSIHNHDGRYYTESEIDTKLKEKLNALLKGSANGLAELDSTGKVPASQLPSFVDDVIEGYMYNGKLYKETAHTTQIGSESGKIYVDLNTEKTYRWSGSAFVVISDTLALGETSMTAYRGDRGKVAYEHSQSAHARSDATKVEASATNGNVVIDGVETQVYKHPDNHDDRYYTESEIDAKLKEKINNNADGADSLLSKITEDWTAAPTDNTNFIRQDTGGKNEFGRVKFSTLWTYIKGKADKVYTAIGHKHTKADITDFPTSMAADGGNSSTVNGHTVNSNVPANAKFTDTNTWRPQPDWNATSGDAVIKNKPSLGTAASKNIEDFAVVSILEEAKYNALSEAEQKNGTIYFTY